jgi:hypothetical protein
VQANTTTLYKGRLYLLIYIQYYLFFSLKNYFLPEKKYCRKLEVVGES